jgi:hypothetical protein
MPDCPTSGQSGIGMIKPNDDETGPVLTYICIRTHICIRKDVRICICMYMYINAKMPDCPASDHSGTRMKKTNNDICLVRYIKL